MPFFGFGAMLVGVVIAVAGMQMWAEQVRLREEVRQLREAQDTLIDLVSTKLLSDDSLEKEFLKLKLNRARPEGD